MNCIRSTSRLYSILKHTRGIHPEQVERSPDLYGDLQFIFNLNVWRGLILCRLIVSVCRHPVSGKQFRVLDHERPRQAALWTLGPLGTVRDRTQMQVVRCTRRRETGDLWCPSVRPREVIDRQVGKSFFAQPILHSYRDCGISNLCRHA